MGDTSMMNEDADREIARNPAQNKNQRASIEKRIDMDLVKRSLPGVLIYAFLWPIIFLPINLHHELPFISWGYASGFILLSLLRALHWFFTNSLYFYSPKLWLMIFAFLSLTQALLWGSLFALSLFYPPMEKTTMVLAFAIAAMSSGALSALNPRLWIANTNVALLILPGLFLTLFIQANYPMAVLITIFLTYLLLLGWRSHREYIRAFDIELKLEEQRQSLERLNKLDPLTGIFNRGHFNHTLDFQWNSGLRRQQAQSLLLIDIDHFKSINDRYGHLVGDQCLISVARQIYTTAKRKTDLIARYGGEEFAVLLSDTSLPQSLEVAEMIRSNIEAYFLKSEFRVTVSIGVACLQPSEDKDPNQLVLNADQALYLAKETGRNRVCLFS